MRTVTDVDTRIEGHVHIAPRVLHRHQSGRDGEMVKQQIMLQIAADVGAVHAKGIVAVRASDMVRLRQRLTEITADQVLVAEFCPEGCTSCSPVKIVAEAHPIDIGAVVVVFHFLWLSPVTLIAIPVLVPVDVSTEMKQALLRLCLNGGVEFRGVLILVVGLPFRRCPESAGTPSLVSDTQVPVQTESLIVILTLIESLRPTEIRIQMSCLRTAVSVAASVIGGNGGFEGVSSLESGVSRIPSA